ncbi:DUF2798 domain-containing protein [Chryseobacterium wangxinyae]|uniref:DUF2798 domain-containing protein n=1 Tax=Chryseobacterium sp. CY350 TaxID=2997336 RepID=UPI003B636981
MNIIYKSFLITMVITFTLNIVNNNYQLPNHFFQLWLKSWSIAFGVTLLFNFILFPSIKTLQNKIKNCN